jgi:hypothetical protein
VSNQRVEFIFTNPQFKVVLNNTVLEIPQQAIKERQVLSISSDELVRASIFGGTIRERPGRPPDRNCDTIRTDDAFLFVPIQCNHQAVDRVVGLSSSKDIPLKRYPSSFHSIGKHHGCISLVFLLLAEGGEVQKLPQMRQPEHVGGISDVQISTGHMIHADTVITTSDIAGVEEKLSLMVDQHVRVVYSIFPTESLPTDGVTLHAEPAHSHA